MYITKKQAIPAPPNPAQLGQLPWAAVSGTRIVVASIPMAPIARQAKHRGQFTAETEGASKICEPFVNAFFICVYASRVLAHSWFVVS
jgi:hypothetical protein